MVYGTENKYYVYEWFIVPTDEVFYVGKGCGDRYKTLSKRNRFFLDMYRTHDCDVRFIETNLYEEDAYQLEYDTIRWYRDHTTYRLTNQTDGGDGTRGFHPSTDQIRKIGMASRAMWANEEWKSAVIAKRYREDSAYQSQAFKDKMAKIVSGSNNPNYQNYWTSEMRERLSIKQKTSGRYDGAQNPNSKAIQCVETGEVFSCINDARVKYNVKHPSSFTVALLHQTRTAAGLHWMTVPEPPTQ